MERKPLSVKQLLSRIQYDMTRRSKRDPIGYADLVEEKMKEKRAAEEYKKSLEEAQMEREEKIASKFQEIDDQAKEERRAHPEKYGPVYFGNSCG
jgi:hypothetical protein